MSIHIKDLQLTQSELERIKKIPRFTKGQTILAGNEFYFIDSASFISSYMEIVKRSFYFFKSCNDFPLIIDCGANIGLSTIYFKKLYPSARITCFEADENVASVLGQNLKSFGFNDIDTRVSALWGKKCEMKFYSDGADGGKICTNMQNVQLKKVETETLRNYLQSKIDLLKIDIEGAEISVLQECADLLCNVKSLFVEYHCNRNEPIELSCLFSILEKAGFRLYMEPGTKVLNPFVQRHFYNEMEILLNIFAYRN
tara:strand:+ start:131 stop:898 length:768 start_codon:yes stop_codon:yes gene_type:complete